jgi:hypothetical protein
MSQTTTEEAAPTPAEARAMFRRTLLRVMIAQAVALGLLWWLQSRYAL